MSRLEFADAMVMFRKAVRDQQVDVPPEEVALANQYFDMLDRRKRGVIPGPALVNFFKQFGLSQQELVPIWYVILSCCVPTEDEKLIIGWLNFIQLEERSTRESSRFDQTRVCEGVLHGQTEGRCSW